MREDENDDANCWISLKSSSSSIKNERKWIQSNICEHWSYEKCADYLGFRFYVCDRCKTDTSEERRKSPKTSIRIIH